MGEMTKEQIAEYKRMTADSKQMTFNVEDLLPDSGTGKIYGYARVSTRNQSRDGNSLEAQEKALKEAGATAIFKDVYTGTTIDRPQLDKLVCTLKKGDTLVVTKLDRVSRSVQQGIELIDGLCESGVKVHVLNMGLMDNSPTGKLIRNIMLSFAEFEREMILQRTREGKMVARTKPGYKEGRPKKFLGAQINHAVNLLETGYSYTQVVRMTGISKSTLIRAKKEKDRDKK